MYAQSNVIRYFGYMKAKGYCQKNMHTYLTIDVT